MGRISFPPWLIALLIAVCIALAVDQLLVRRKRLENSKFIRDLSLDGFIIIFLLSRLIPALSSMDMIFRDPLALLYRPAGPADIVLAAALFIVYAAFRLYRARRPTVTRRLLSDLGLVWAVFLVIFFIASLAVTPLISPTVREELRETTEKTGRKLRELGLPRPAGQERETIRWDADFLVINLWATWCPPCRGEIPELRSFYAGVEDGRVELIGVNLSSTESSMTKVESFIEEHRINFPVLLDERGKFAEMVGSESIPTTIILDREGGIVARRSGAVGESWLRRHTAR